MTDHIAAQGRMAKEQNLTPMDCPYGPGANADAWMKGYGEPAEAVTQPEPPPAIDKYGNLEGQTVREAGTKGKGKKKTAGETQVVQTVDTPGGSLVTKRTASEAGKADGVGAEAVIGDPSASTNRAAGHGAGITTGVNQEEALAGALEGQPNMAEARDKAAADKGDGPTGNANVDVDPKTLE